MKILPSTIERLLYYILFLIFVVFIIFFVLTEQQNNQLKDLGQKIVKAQETIIQNQTIQTQANKIYINCIVHINPAGDVQSQLNTCFNAAPKVKK